MGRLEFVVVLFKRTFKMASTLSRVCLRGANLLKNTQSIVGTSRTFSVSALRSKEETTGPDAIEHATGIEKWELMAAQAGNDDPFYLRMKSRSAFKGTKDDPIVVDALDNHRMIGCVCEEHDCHIKWMWLIEGRNKRCQCGHWFSLKTHEAPDRYELPL